MTEPGIPLPQQLKFMYKSYWIMIRSFVGAFCSDLTKNMTNVSIEWRKWRVKPNPDSGILPKYVNEKSDFEKLFVLRALCDDHMD